MSGEDDYFDNILYSIILFIVLCIGIIEILFLINNKTEESPMRFSTDITFTPQESTNRYYLGDYHFLGSYNCCCDGKMTGGIVRKGVLQSIIEMGIRYLDFEVFSIRGKTCVSISKDHDIFTSKSAINEIPINEICELISLYAFTNNVTNRSDPLFVQFRIKSRIRRVYDDTANAIRKYLDGHLLGPKFAFNGRHLDRDILFFPFNMFQQKAIIVIHEPPNEQLLEQSSLHELSNIVLLPRHVIRISGKNTMTNQTKRYYEKNSRNQLLITMPSGENVNNYDVRFALSSGFNAILLNIQNEDAYYYNAISLFNPYAVKKKEDHLQLSKENWKIDVTGVQRGAGLESEGTGNILGQTFVVKGE